jgi:hypothetical protein
LLVTVIQIILQDGTANSKIPVVEWVLSTPSLGAEFQPPGDQGMEEAEREEARLGKKN